MCVIALFFAFHVFWHDYLSGIVEWPAMVLAVVATIINFRFKANVIPVILVSGLTGMAIKLPV